MTSRRKQESGLAGAAPVQSEATLSALQEIMREQHDGRRKSISAKVVAPFESDVNERISQMRESFDLGPVLAQLEAAG
jgi:hypothetical protein